MKYYLFLFASLAILILGVGHLIFEVFQNALLGPPDPEVQRVLVSYQIQVFGFSRSLSEFMHGFSATMGVFMIAYGSLNTLLIAGIPASILSYPAVSLFNALLCLTVFLLSCVFFHWPPIIFFFLAFVAYLLVFFMILNSNKFEH